MHECRVCNLYTHIIVSGELALELQEDGTQLAVAGISISLTPYCLAPALIRCIHRDRISLFLVRRSR